MKCFSDLPDDCLIVLFERHFALQEQIQLRAICTRWKSVIESMCSRKRTLKLFENRCQVGEYIGGLVEFGHTTRTATKHLTLQPIGCANDDLLIEQLHLDCAKFLVSLFPNVQQLVLHFHNCRGDGLDSVYYLLDQWGPSLTHLALSGAFRLEQSEKRSQMYVKINALPELRCLDLLTDSLFIPCYYHPLYERAGPFKVELDSRLLGHQLEHLSLRSHHSDLVPVLSSLGPKCTKLYINLGHFEMDDWVRALTPKPAITDSLQELLLRGYRFDGELLIKLICDNFPLLKILHIDLWNYEKEDKYDYGYMNEFAKLTHLTELAVQLYYSNWPFLQSTWPQLFLVKSFQLHLYVDSLRNVEHFDCAPFCEAFASLLPNVEAVSIKLSIDMRSTSEVDNKAKAIVVKALEENLDKYFVNLRSHRVYDDDCKSNLQYAGRFMSFKC